MQQHQLSGPAIGHEGSQNRVDLVLYVFLAVQSVIVADAVTLVGNRRKPGGVKQMKPADFAPRVRDIAAAEVVETIDHVLRGRAQLPSGLGLGQRKIFRKRQDAAIAGKFSGDADAQLS